MSHRLQSSRVRASLSDYPPLIDNRKLKKTSVKQTRRKKQKQEKQLSKKDLALLEQLSSELGYSNPPERKHYEDDYDSFPNFQPQPKPKRAASSKKTSAAVKKQQDSLLNQLINHLPAEMHAPGYNYLGPGTDYENRVSGKKGKKRQIPINKLDYAAMLHDKAYTDYSDVANRTVADKKLREEVQSIYHDSNTPLTERALAYATDKVFALKNMIGGGLERKPKRKYTKKKQVSFNNPIEELSPEMDAGTVQQAMLYDTDSDEESDSEDEY